jgi:hypothetical protein
MMDVRSTIFQELDNLVACGYGDDWDGLGHSIYDAWPMHVVLDVAEEIGVERKTQLSLDAMARFVREWQDARRPR